VGTTFDVRWWAALSGQQRFDDAAIPAAPSTRAQGSAGATPATRSLVAAGVQHVVHAYAHDPRAHAEGLRYAAEAAAALGGDPRRIFKTLVTEVDQKLVVAVVPAPAQLDLRALATAVRGKRAALAPAPVAERATGYVLGGISPLGQRRRLPTVIDSSALDHETVLVSAGRRGLDVELSPLALISLTRATTATIARG